MTFASPLEVGSIFAELCAIPSPSGSEGAVGTAVTRLLDGLGIDWWADGAAAELGGDQDNLHFIIPSGDGRREGGILLCAHLDTVPPGRSIQPRLVEGVWSNGGDGILGADNKAAVAAVLCASARWVNEPPSVPVEVLLTVSEETGLRGVRAFPIDRLTATAGFVFDHPTPVGTMVRSSPGHTGVEVSVSGRSAHAGVRPEDGANAVVAASRAVAGIPSGRLDERTTMNVGLIHGGDALNVVPDECRFGFEVRSPDPTESARLVLEATDSIQQAVDAEGCATDISIEVGFRGYEHRDGHPALDAGRRALGEIGIEPVEIGSGGGSDANVLNAAGIPTLNLGDGCMDTHTPDERVANADLELLVRLALALPSVS